MQEKIKMHQCQICNKRFPRSDFILQYRTKLENAEFLHRPSGLKLHMNTHNHEKRLLLVTSCFFLTKRWIACSICTNFHKPAFFCNFPGCTRAFNVPSNAKRHLRTHGTSEAQASLYNNTPIAETPSVIEFMEPQVLLHDVDNQGVTFPRMPTAIDVIVDDPEQSARGKTVSILPPKRRSPEFRIRWLPPRVTSRLNPARPMLAVENQPTNMDDVADGPSYRQSKGKQRDRDDDADRDTTSDDDDEISSDKQGDEEEREFLIALAASKLDTPPVLGSSSASSSS